MKIQDSQDYDKGGAILTGIQRSWTYPRNFQFLGVFSKAGLAAPEKAHLN